MTLTVGRRAYRAARHRPGGQWLRRCPATPRPPDGRTRIVLDEATSYGRWSLAIKNLVDRVCSDNLVSYMIVTSSYSLELSEAKSIEYYRSP